MSALVLTFSLLRAAGKVTPDCCLGAVQGGTCRDSLPTLLTVSHCRYLTKVWRRIDAFAEKIVQRLAAEPDEAREAGSSSSSLLIRGAHPSCSQHGADLLSRTDVKLA